MSSVHIVQAHFLAGFSRKRENKLHKILQKGRWIRKLNGFD